jgi:hypothetical protein
MTTQADHTPLQSLDALRSAQRDIQDAMQRLLQATQMPANTPQAKRLRRELIRARRAELEHYTKEFDALRIAYRDDLIEIVCRYVAGDAIEGDPIDAITFDENGLMFINSRLVIRGEG